MPFIIALLIGGGAILFGVISRKQHAALVQVCTAQTTGTVVRIEEEIRTETYEDEEEENEEERLKTREVTTYYPVIEYTAGEQTITQRGSIGSSHPKFQAGAQVSICYNPNKPCEFYPAGDTSGSKVGTILIIAGAGIILVGLVLSFL